ncbi:MAG TPA: TIR domain-containing protein [Caulobacterales bacterium]|nr:TIR domain-containing protein [Caulobacterales bacterium]
MASVVIVHAAEDTPPARALAEKLRQMGLQPVVEQTGDALHSAMRGAKAMVALWSPRSASSSDLVEEVKLAKGMGPVIHARMQNAATPADFSGEASIDLTGWRGEDGFPAWRALAIAVAEKTGVTPPPRPPSHFFQPGAPGAAAAAVAPPRQAPPPTAPAPDPAPRAADFNRAELNRTGLEADEPRSGGGKLAVIGAITFVVVAALGGGGYFAWTQMQGSQASAAAWEHLDKTSPAQLRAFLQDNPGAYRDQAQGTLTELEQHRWSAARSADTMDALNAFLNDFPHSDHALEARGRIAELQSAPATTTPIPDSLTPLPPASTDPDLLPPGVSGAPETTAPAQTAPSQQGPVSLTPPPQAPPPTPTPQDQPIPNH